MYPPLIPGGCKILAGGVGTVLSPGGLSTAPAGIWLLGGDAGGVIWTGTSTGGGL